MFVYGCSVGGGKCCEFRAEGVRPEVCVGQGEAGYWAGVLYGSTVVGELVGGGADGRRMVVVVSLRWVRIGALCCIHLNNGVEDIMDRDTLRSGRG